MGAGQRLRRRAEFQRVYSEGLKVVGRYVVLFFRKGEGEVCRWGVTVSRRIGGAVVRNRARRRIRELVRRSGEGLKGLGGDLVVNARGGCGEVPWQVLEEDWRACLGRLRRTVVRGRWR